MRYLLVLVIVGLSLTLLGFAILFASLDGRVPLEVGLAGLPMILLGLLLFVGSLTTYALRRPTRKELASQKAGDYRTWHFRPAGLLILVVGLATYVAVASWAEQYVPGINSGRPSPSGFVFGLVCLALLSFRKVRSSIFYLGEIPKAKAAADKSEQRADQSTGAIRRPFQDL